LTAVQSRYPDIATCVRAAQDLLGCEAGMSSAAEKATSIAESYGAGETVCCVARRHGLTSQQLFTLRGG